MNSPTAFARQDSVDTEPTINSLRVLRSGWAEQHKEHRYGSRVPQLWWVLTSRSWVKLPISFFLIGHRNGPVLFDTGLDPAILSNPKHISHPIEKFLSWAAK